jgi:hypothetical protein
MKKKHQSLSLTIEKKPQSVQAMDSSKREKKHQSTREPIDYNQLTNREITLYLLLCYPINPERFFQVNQMTRRPHEKEASITLVN